MPWSTMTEVPISIRKHKGIALTLSQANRWAEIRDAIKRERRKVKSPEAVAWSIWNREYKVKDNEWIRVKTVDEQYISNHVGNTSLIEQGRHPYFENSVEAYQCECLECGNVIESKEHCENIKCPICNGDMRRLDRPGIGKEKSGSNVKGQRRNISTEYEEHAVARAFGHPAGQMLQSKRIISLIPNHSKFVEPFAGSATIFFSKNPTDGTEVLNDLNPEYVRALKSLKSMTDAEIQTIVKKNWKGSKKYHDKIKALTPPKNKVDWLHWFLYKTTFSFGSMGKSFDSSDEGHTCTLNQPKRFEKIRDRMKNAEITRIDFRDSINEHDSPETFFYIDPPYYASKDKRASSFKIGQVDLDEFVYILKSIKGKFITSIGNEPDWIKKMKSAGFNVQKLTSPRSIPALSKGDKKSTQDWPLISNFPMTHEGVYSIDEFEIEDYDNNIYTPDTLIDEINKSFAFPAVIHEVPDGLRCIIRKRGSEVTVHALDNDNEIDCSVKFPMLREELSKLKNNFTLDSFITGWAQGYRKGKFYGEESVLGYFKRKIKSNDAGLYATVFDLRWLDGTCMEDVVLSNRLQALEYIVGMTEHMKLIEITEANNETELMESVEFHARLSGSLGSHIRSSLGDHSHSGLVYRLHEAWSTKYVNDLPDSAFALVESGGKKDAEGKTVPRSLRHLPYKNDKGGLDLPHLRNAIARVSHVKLKDGQPIPREKRDSITAHLRSLLEKTKDENGQSVNGHVMGEAKGKELSKQEADHSDFIDVYFSMDEVKRYVDNPYSVEIGGVFFHRGEHKETNYDDKNLEKMKLKPRPGESLVYFNFYHDKTEYLKAGILTDLFWDAEVVWLDPINHEKGKGAVMYKAVITHPIAVNEILNENISNISAELFREIDIRSDGKRWAYDIDATGGALTTSPQLPAADIHERCYTDPKTRKKVCI